MWLCDCLSLIWRLDTSQQEHILSFVNLSNCKHKRDCTGAFRSISWGFPYTRQSKTTTYLTQVCVQPCPYVLLWDCFLYLPINGGTTEENLLYCIELLVWESLAVFKFLQYQRVWVTDVRLIQCAAHVSQNLHILLVQLCSCYALE